MVAKITTPKNLMAALNYNENKVKQGKAQCIHAAGYLRTADDMNFYQKLEGFERLNCLNERASTKTIHVSLNFDPSENFHNERLIAIASEYMQKIGFGEQPFLVYKHSDAGHPHVHLVSTTICEDGSRMHTHNIGRNQSETARKELEEKYGLIKAENQKRLIKQKIQPIYAEKIIYGKAETKRSISNVVNAVLHSYKYSSLAEFNAILKQFNIVADRGSEGGKIYKNRGLIYRVLDARGNNIGVPIKASAISSKPTLGNLEKKFLINQNLKDQFKNNVKAKIDESLLLKPHSIAELITELQNKKVYTVLRNSTEGRIYGITFVDNDTKTVFNGSDLGKPYSAGNLQAQILQNEKQTATSKPVAAFDDSKKELVHTNNTIKSEQVHENKSTELIDSLLSPEKQVEGISFQLLKKKRKRKRRSPGL